MTDFAALVGRFKTDARYKQAVTDGRHGDLHVLVNEDKPAGMKWQAVPMAKVKQILAPYLLALTADQRDTLRTLAGDNEMLDLTRKPVRDLLGAIFLGQAIIDLGAELQRKERYADDFAAESVSINQIREACRQVPGSALAKYLDPSTPENVARQAKSADITRVGQKLERLRQAMIAKGKGPDFAAFRFGGTSRFGEEYADLPAGVYAQPEDQRESFIDAKMTAEGVA